MKSDSIAFGVAGIVFGLIAGWIIGTQQAALKPPVQPPAQQQQADAGAQNPPPAMVDEAKVSAFKNIVDKDSQNAEARIQLGNLYFDADRYQDAIPWYEQALKLTPRDINVNTDLGVCYYNVNEPDKALEQFNKSLKLDPKHTKTLLNIGIVKAFAKQDLDGALAAWQQVVDIAPNSPEGQKAQQGIQGIRAAHPGGTKPGN